MALQATRATQHVRRCIRERARIAEAIRERPTSDDRACFDPRANRRDRAADKFFFFQIRNAAAPRPRGSGVGDGARENRAGWLSARNVSWLRLGQSPRSEGPETSVTVRPETSVTVRPTTSETLALICSARSHQPIERTTNPTNNFPRMEALRRTLRRRQGSAEGAPGSALDVCAITPARGGELRSECPGRSGHERR